MSKPTIAVFQISTEEDLRFQLDFQGLSLTGRTLRVNVRRRDTGALVQALTSPSNMTLAGVGNLTVFYPKASMSAWAKTEYEADVIDETGGTYTRIMAVRFVYDEPGKLVYGVRGNQATVTFANNQATVTAIGGVGPPGPANVITIGDVETLEAGEEATASLTGVAPTQVLNLGLPKGATGTAATIAVGVVTTVAPGEDAAVTNSGTSGAAVLDFEIPAGAAATVGVGTVTTGAAGSSASVTNAGTSSAATLNFTIPRGDKGENGWTPETAVVSDGERRVQQVVDWQGGGGTKPATGLYVGATGLVAVIEDAVDIRGDQGPAMLIDDLTDGSDNVTYHSLVAVAESMAGNLKQPVARIFGPAGKLDFQSVSAAEATDIPASIKGVVVWDLVDDDGDDYYVYRRVDAEPVSGGKFRSSDRYLSDGETDLANGGWWELRPNFLASNTGAVARTRRVKLREWASPDDYGAGNTSDDTLSFMRALEGGRRVRLLDHTYSVQDTIEMDEAGQGLIGMGRGKTIITSNQASAPVITLASGVPRYLVRGVHVTKSVISTSGGDGIKCLGTTNETEISDVYVSNCWDGISLGTCDTGLLQSVEVFNNFSRGVFGTNAVAYGPAQWNFKDVIARINASHGILIQSTAGPAGLILGTWHDVRTFANGGYAVALLGNSTTPIYDLRLSDAFIGSDALGGVYLDTYGGKHRIMNSFIERIGRDANGRNSGTAATNTGHGIEVSANNADLAVTAAKIDENSYNGIFHSGGVLILSGSCVNENGAATSTGNRSGLLSNGGQVIATGNKIGNLNSSIQSYGIASSHGNVVIVGNDLSGNGTAPLSLTTSSETVVLGNSPAGQLSIVPGAVQFKSLFHASATGGDQGDGTINVAAGLFKNGVAYNNP